MKRTLPIVIIALFVLVAAPPCAAQSQALLNDQAYAVSGDITPPQLTEVASPDYTAEARRKKIEGSVTMTIVVSKRGDVTDARVVQGLGYGLDENALLAVKEWKYKPAERNGEPVAVKMEVSVNFYLNR